MPWYVYITDKNGRMYVGITTDPENRAEQHGSPLLYVEPLESRESAVNRERQIKHWSRAKKQALIDRDNDQLRHLSRGRS